MKAKEVQLYFKKAILEDMDRLKSKIGGKELNRLFDINDKERQILDAYFKVFSPTKKKDKDFLSRSTFDIVSDLHNIYNFTQGQLITYMLEKGYQLDNDGFEFLWILYWNK